MHTIKKLKRTIVFILKLVLFFVPVRDLFRDLRHQQSLAVQPLPYHRRHHGDLRGAGHRPDAGVWRLRCGHPEEQAHRPLHGIGHHHHRFGDPPAAVHYEHQREEQRPLRLRDAPPAPAGDGAADSCHHLLRLFRQLRVLLPGPAGEVLRHLLLPGEPGPAHPQDQPVPQAVRDRRDRAVRREKRAGCHRPQRHGVPLRRAHQGAQPPHRLLLPEAEEYLL